MTLIFGQDGFDDAIAIQVGFAASRVTGINGRMPYRQGMRASWAAVYGNGIDGIGDALQVTDGSEAASHITLQVITQGIDDA